MNLPEHKLPRLLTSIKLAVVAINFSKRSPNYFQER